MLLGFKKISVFITNQHMFLGPGPKLKSVFQMLSSQYRFWKFLGVVSTKLKETLKVKDHKNLAIKSWEQQIKVYCRLYLSESKDFQLPSISQEFIFQWDLKVSGLI